MIETETHHNCVTGNSIAPLQRHAVSVETLTEEEGFESLQDEWNELVRNSDAANIFLTWEWISTWWRHFGKRARLHVLVMRDAGDGRLVGLLPLMQRRQPFSAGPIRELAFLGCTTAAPDHQDLIARAEYERPVVEAAVTTLTNPKMSWDLLRLEGMSAASKLLSSLPNALPTARLLQWETHCPYLDLPNDWDEFFVGLDRKLQNNFRRQERRLEEHADGPVTCHQVTDSSELEAALSDLLDLHRQIRNGQGEAGSFGGEAMQKFHREVAGKFLENDWLRLYRLKVGERTIAASYCFSFAETVSLYQTGYDRNFSRYGPGARIIMFALRQAIEDGAKTFDFLRGNHPYKYQWTDLTRHDVKFRMAATIKGRAFLSTYGLLRNVRRKWKTRSKHKSGS